MATVSTFVPFFDESDEDDLYDDSYIYDSFIPYDYESRILL